MEQPATDRHRDIHLRRSYTVNPRATPAELTIYGDNFLMLCRYKLDGDKLTLATFGRSEVERPVGFTRAENKTALPLIVHTYRRVKEPKTPGAVLEQMQGTWETVTLTQDGKLMTPVRREDWLVVIDGDRMRQGQAKGEAAIKLDPTAVPSAIDMVEVSSKKGDDDAVLRGIYRLDGDTLELCHALPGQPRPTRFDAPAGSEQRLFVFKRAKK